MNFIKSNIKYILIFILLIFFGVCAPIINYQYHKWLGKQKQMYCYSDFRGVKNPAFLIPKTSKDELIKYYQLVEVNPKANPIIKFGINTVPTNKKVFVIKYSEDSLIAKIVIKYSKATKFHGALENGWVYSKTLHENGAN